MEIKLINIGFGNIVSANRIIAIVSPESSPIKRIIQESRDKGMLIDATYGRRTRAVIITDSDHVILSAVQPETVAHRLNSKDSVLDTEEWVANRIGQKPIFTGIDHNFDLSISIECTIAVGPISAEKWFRFHFGHKGFKNRFGIRKTGIITWSIQK